jgi:photosystem II stability/assembly factor-like uncharacterized protein
MKKLCLFFFVLTVFFITTTGSVSAFDSPLKVGWVIGDDDNNNAVILHTKNWGRKWVVQGKWASESGGMDISAVDKQTAWASLDSPEGKGMILHTTNGGVTWKEQKVPDDVDQIKSIKGLTRHEAWAVSLTGTILHTTDGGENWIEVDSGIDMKSVNRIDAIGFRDLRTGKISANVWIADHYEDDDFEKRKRGMIHTLYNGEIWRQEYVPLENPGDPLVHMVSAYSPRVAWSAEYAVANLFRTVDGGETWNKVATAGHNDIDDLCAYSADAVWAAKYESWQDGSIYHVRVFDAGDPEVRPFRPASGYAYGGLTCVDDQTALVVGYTWDPELPKGVIASTTDGGDNWVPHPLPVDDVRFWKVSFVGGHR